MQVLTTAPSLPHRYVSFSELEARAADERAAQQAAEAAAAEAAAARAAVRTLAAASLEQVSEEIDKLQVLIDELQVLIDEAHAQLALLGFVNEHLLGEAETIVAPDTAQAVCNVSTGGARHGASNTTRRNVSTGGSLAAVPSLSGAVTSSMCMLGLAAEPSAGTPPPPPPPPPDVQVEIGPASPPADLSAFEGQHASARYGALQAQLALAQSRCARRCLPTGPLPTGPLFTGPLPTGPLPTGPRERE